MSHNFDKHEFNSEMQNTGRREAKHEAYFGGSGSWDALEYFFIIFKESF